MIRKGYLMGFQIGQRVRITDDAFPGSDEPADIAARGTDVRIVRDLGLETPGWNGCYIVETPDGSWHPVVVEELTPIPQED